VTVFDDDVDMREQAWADRLLQGDAVDAESGLSDLIAAVRASADAPAPTPNAALATLLRDGLPSADVPAARSMPEQVRYWGSRTFRVGVAGVAASLAMGAGVATAAAGGGGPLSYVPEPVKRGVDAAVTAVADVLRSTPESPAPAPSEQGSTTSRSNDDADEPDKATPAAVVEPTAPATTPAPVRPSPTAAPTPVATNPAPSAEPQPTQSEASASPSSLPSPGPEGSPSQSPEGEGRKPLDTASGSPSPSPSPSPEESEQAPDESEPQVEEGEQDPSDPPAEEKKDKPGRAELTIERFETTA
jgi:hypothetical protein